MRLKGSVWIEVTLDGVVEQPLRSAKLKAVSAPSGPNVDISHAGYGIVALGITEPALPQTLVARRFE